MEISPLYPCFNRSYHSCTRSDSPRRSKSCFCELNVTDPFARSKRPTARSTTVCKGGFREDDACLGLGTFVLPSGKTRMLAWGRIVVARPAGDGKERRVNTRCDCQ